MPISPQMQAQYEENRMQMMEINKRFKIYMWAQLIISILFFVFSMYAGATSTLTDQEHRGPAKFYYAMEAGTIQILLAIGSLVLGFVGAMRKRPATFALLGIYVFMLIYAVSGHMQLGFANAGLFVGGIALNAWIQAAFGDLSELKEQPGYPHFSILNEQNKEYEAPLYVTHRQSADDMASIGGTGAEKVTLSKKTASVQTALNADAAFSEMTVPERRASAETALPKPDIALETFSETEKKTQTAEAQKQAALARQQAMEAAMLSEMTPENAHHHHDGDASMLPSADEVRARMAAMKKARQNGEI